MLKMSQKMNIYLYIIYIYFKLFRKLKWMMKEIFIFLNVKLFKKGILGFML